MRSPHVQRFDRVAHSHVPVYAHHRQREGAGEHVVVVDGHHHFAQSVPEWPEAQIQISALQTSRKQSHTTAQGHRAGAPEGTGGQPTVCTRADDAVPGKVA